MRFTKAFGEGIGGKKTITSPRCGADVWYAKRSTKNMSPVRIVGAIDSDGAE
jgi:hypothetical protein